MAMIKTELPWEQEVDVTWMKARIKYNYYLKGRIGWQGLKADEFIDDGPFLVTGTDFINGRVNWNTCYHISDERYEEAPEIHVQHGDLLVTKDGTIGKTAYIEEKPDKVSLNSHLLLMRPLNNWYSNRFLFWVINSAVFETYYNYSQTGTIMASLSQEKISNFAYFMPTRSEQEKIADYLDDRCSEIDEIIVEATDSIEEYKELRQAIINQHSMFGTNKDVEIRETNYSWFPYMPAHWKLVRANRLFKEDVRPVQDGDVSLSLSQVDGLIPTDNMNEHSLKSATHDNWKHVIPEDLVLNRFKGHLGVFFASNYEGMVSFHYGVYHAVRGGVLAKYYEYLFHSTTYKSIFALLSNGITVGLQNLSNGNFYSVKLLLPPIEEQIDIVKCLDERTSQIDALISEKQALIDDLQAYKKSLIYEVVTGKRRVV